MRIDRVEIFAVQLPLHRPFVSSLGETSSRDLGILRLTDEDGRQGLGEITPYPDPPAMTLAELLETFEGQLREALEKTTLGSEGLQSARTLPAPIRCAVDVAILDLEARREEVRVADLLSDRVEERIAVNATITSEAPDEVAVFAREAVDAGFNTIKLKVGFSDRDTARLAALRDEVGFEPLLRLDANGRWRTTEAIERIGVFQEFGLELVEQPVDPGDLNAMHRVRDASLVPVVADEGVRSTEDLELHLANKACDGVAIKLSEVGGISAAMALATSAKHAGLLAFVTSTLDGPIGLAAGLHFAAARPDFSLANGLATGELFESTYGTGLPDVESGHLALSESPGLGVELDEAALIELAAP
jgi:L-alanine-DL-glutamate epimerase-like enolase superfamily enzyme